MKLYQRLLMKCASVSPLRIRIQLYKLSGMRIGNKTRISLGFFVDRPEGVIIGNDCFFNHFVHLHCGADHNEHIELGNNVFVGPDVVFTCASHTIGTEKQRAGAGTYGTIVVEDGVWIGAHATILSGVRIGRGGVIGAGAVVTKSTEPNGLYLGIPAKRVRDLGI